MAQPVPPGIAPPPAPGPHAGPDPYRVLFPIGVAFAIAGVAPWIVLGLGGGTWPGRAHAALMIEGFEQSFVLGFLLTAMPGFTRGERCRRWELAAAALSVALFGVLVATGPAWAAHLAFALGVALVGRALVARLVRTRRLPPEEFAFVGLGLLMGLAGAALLVAEEAAGLAPPAPRLGLRLISLGMVLSIVLGVGGLLVPTFAGIRDPLALPGIAGAHQRGGRRPLYVVVALALVAAFGLEAAGHPGFGAWLRAAAATAMLALAWKIWRRPGRRGRHPLALWAAGWSVLAGLWGAALWPAQQVAAYHVVFVGGFGLLTLAIGSRVVTAHGRHPPAAEESLVSVPLLGLVGLALVSRVAAPLLPRGFGPALAVAAALWIAAWVLWAAGALPRVARLGPARPPAAGRVAEPR